MRLDIRACLIGVIEMAYPKLDWQNIDQRTLSDAQAEALETYREAWEAFVQTMQVGVPPGYVLRVSDRFGQNIGVALVRQAAVRKPETLADYLARNGR